MLPFVNLLSTTSCFSLPPLTGEGAGMGAVQSAMGAVQSAMGAVQSAANQQKSNGCPTHPICALRAAAAATGPITIATSEIAASTISGAATPPVPNATALMVDTPKISVGT